MLHIKHQFLQTGAFGMAGDPWNAQPKAKPKVGPVKHLDLTPEPFQLRLILSKAPMAIVRLLLS